MSDRKDRGLVSAFAMRTRLVVFLVGAALMMPLFVLAQRGGGPPSGGPAEISSALYDDVTEQLTITGVNLADSSEPEVEFDA